MIVNLCHIELIIYGYISFRDGKFTAFFLHIQIFLQFSLRMSKKSSTFVHYFAKKQIYYFQI